MHAFFCNHDISDLNIVPLQNPKFQEPVTLDFLDAELENDIKVGVKYPAKKHQPQIGIELMGTVPTKEPVLHQIQ